jgi:uncharacterized small protein (DUF1192 family)
VGDPVARMAEARQAMSNATWVLLRQEKWAPIIFATLRSVFDQGLTQMPADEFYARVTRAFDAMREYDGDFPVPVDDVKAVREHCKAWVAKGWLVRQVDSDGATEVYRVSAEARDAIRIVEQMTNLRAAMSESQVRVVLDRARALALKATADPESRISSLGEEIEQLEADLAKNRAELDRLMAGGTVELADEEEVLNDFLVLRDEIDRLPSDLKRVEDSFEQLAQSLREAFLAETRPHGEVVGAYIQRAENLSSEDRYGRGFQQAKRLLTDDAARQQLREHLTTILSHPFAQVLSGRERRDLRGTVHMISACVSAVFEQRRMMTKRLTRFVTERDSLRERELHQALRQAQTQLRTWSAEHGPRHTLVLPIGHHADDAGVSDGPVIARGEVAVASIATFREKPLQRRIRTALKSLVDCQGSGAVVFSAEELRARGGPFYSELADAIQAATRDGAAVPAARLFNRLPDSVRRPVDLLGLFALATARGAPPVGPAVEEFHTIRPDGSLQTFLGPVVAFTATFTEETADRG